jgi:hypothetical protein
MVCVMSAILLAFPQRVKFRADFSSSVAAVPPCAPAAQEDAAELAAWLAQAAGYGWFLVEAPERPSDPPCHIIGHRAVDEEGIFQLRPDFDGWELLSRRGELLVYTTLRAALHSICPISVAA